MREFRIIQGDSLASLRTLPAESVHCCITSPPYWGLRDYGVAGQLGLEKTPEEYTARMVEVFAQVRRVLRQDGTLWLNLGDSYAGGGGFSASAPSSATSKSGIYGGLGALKAGGIKPQGVIKPKDLVGIPWRVAFALQADGWYLRSDIIWHKPNPMPESVTDRPTKAHEYLFLLTKSERYAYDVDAIREAHVSDFYRAPGPERTAADAAYMGNAPRIQRTKERTGHELGRNKRSVWSIATEAYPESHFAVMPTALVEPCVMAGCPEGGTVLDPFAGSGTVGVVALRHDRRFIGLELNPAYVEMARRRIGDDMPMFNIEVEAGAA